MLGHIFENLLEDNKDKGAYYTPKAVVHYMARQSLSHALAARYPGDAVAPAEIAAFLRLKEPVNAKEDSWLTRHATDLAGHLDDLRICDPAIGSGAFPIGLLHEIYWAKLALNPSLPRAAAKRAIIQNSIHGVDLDAGAVEIARLRFWLALVVDETAPSPLPNLDYQIMQGNSLLESFEGEPLDDLAESPRYGIRRLGSDQNEFDLGGGQVEIVEVPTAPHVALTELRERYFRCHDPVEKGRLRGEIDAAVLQAIDARLARRRDELEISLESETAMVRGRARTAKEQKKRTAMETELAALVGKTERLHTLLAEPRAERPFFLWHLWFRHVLAAAPEGRGGFDIVIANPPYIPMETMPEAERNLFQATYSELTRKFDSSAVFILHSLGLLKPTGCLTFISSVTWQTGENYAELRKTLFQKAGLTRVINLPFDIFAEAYVDTCIYIISRQPSSSYRISVLPKKGKFEDLSLVPFVDVKTELVLSPSFKLVLNPGASAILRRILQRADVCNLGALTKSTQGLAGNRFQRTESAVVSNSMAFAEDVSVTRYGVAVHVASSVEMGEHLSLIEFYSAAPKLLVRRIISRQDRLIVGRIDEAMVFKKDVSPFLVTDNRIEPSYLLAVLNSRLISWLYVNTSSIATKDDFRQTTLAELRALPVIGATPADQTTLTALVDQILAAKRAGDAAAVARLEGKIDAHVYRLYGLTEAEIALVEGRG